MKTLQIIGIILLIVVATVAVFALEAGIIMLLWNYVLCELFPTIPTLTYGLAVGISYILAILGGVFKVTINTKN